MTIDEGSGGRIMSSRPSHLEVVGQFLAVKWDDGQESVIGLEAMRRACPCAHCAGEPDVTGAVRRPLHAPVFTPRSFELDGLERVGSYAIAVTWGDGHRTGIYSWEYLRRLGEVDAG